MSILPIAFLIALGLAASAIAKPIPLSYLSPDGSLKAVVIPLGREAGATEIEDDSEYECRVDIYTHNGRKIWSQDFSSPDHDHGRGITFASWSPDSNYFVFSTFSSGGHHAWQFFTYAYARKQNDLHLLDRFIGEVTDPKFAIARPDVISLKILDRSVKNSTGDSPSKKVKVSLSKLLDQKTPVPKYMRVNPPLHSPY